MSVCLSVLQLPRKKYASFRKLKMVRQKKIKIITHIFGIYVHVSCLYVGICMQVHIQTHATIMVVSEIAQNVRQKIVLKMVLIKHLHVTELVLKGLKQCYNKGVKNICICPVRII